MSSRPCSPAAASTLDVDDQLAEIILRLPPQRSSLPHASAGCKRWRLLVSDPRFLRRFRIRHRRNPALLGFFIENILPCLDLSFEPTPDGAEFTVMRAEDGGLGFLFLSGYDAQLWNGKKDSDGVVSWALRRTI